MRGKTDPYGIIGETNDRSVRGNSDFVLALQDISFDVQQGDLIGLIGKNGSGKSTLLKILSKITAPSTGVVKLRGRVASMLEVGTGFHPELTGKENVYLNGTIMGMTKKEVAHKFDEIVDFAGVARYIDTPIKRYSSGMSVRLAFSVAAHLDPEILLVDEVLAVGDTEFQKKSIGKMSEVGKAGRTIIFVSHNLGSIRKLCTRGLVLDNGKMIYSGEVEASIDQYLNSLPTSDAEGHNVVTFPRDDNKLFQFLEVGVKNEYGHARGTFVYDEQIFVQVRYIINEACRNFSTKIAIIRNGDVLFWSFDTDENDELLSMRSAGEYMAKVALPGFLKSGTYTLSISFFELGIEKEEHNDVIRFVLSDSNVDTTTKSYHQEKPGILRPRLDWVYIEHPIEI